MTDALRTVREFWDTGACGADFVPACADERAYFRSFREFRYRTEWHIAGFAQFALARGKRLLEIGCGNGADGAMFARHGADYTGVDLTAEAVSATRRHFAAEGLPGTFRQDNAEGLGFADAAFDIVYSYGVLHHSPSPQRAVREVHRVLKPDGVALIMLYHRHSFNYYARILGYMRTRVLLNAVLRGRTGGPAGQKLRGVRGNASTQVWEIHRENFLRMGWDYLRARNFVHHCTDGPECPYAYTFSRRQAAELFAQFRHVEMTVAHFPLAKYFGASALPGRVERWAAKHMGWHLLIRAIK